MKKCLKEEKRVLNDEIHYLKQKLQD
jgi:hypothetical protein